MEMGDDARTQVSLLNNEGAERSRPRERLAACSIPHRSHLGLNAGV